MSPMPRRLNRLPHFLLAAVLCLAALRLVILAAVTPQPPPVQAPLHHLELDHDIRRFGSSWARVRHGILQVHLEGSPEAIGAAHSSLLGPEMASTEGALWEVFENVVPTTMLRSVVVDTARVRYAGLESSIGHARRAELAAAANAIRPDPLASEIPTYSRFLLLNALYDVALAFEGGPLIGCSSVYLSGDAAAGGPMLGRNFDFETHDVFDRGKAVILFAETGKVPVVSVAWPGLAGVVTGMNAEGVGAVVHGARAGEPSASGQPVLLTLREALASAHDASDVARWLSEHDAMVSHMVLVGDAEGNALIVERVPGRAAHVRAGTNRTALTNHLEGPNETDPANQRIRTTTSTLARRARLDVLLQNQTLFDTAKVIDVLRDRRDSGGRPLAAGDRNAIDADIATHGVVMELAARVIRVSQGPHLSGRFVPFDIGRWIDDPGLESRSENRRDGADATESD